MSTECGALLLLLSGSDRDDLAALLQQPRSVGRLEGKAKAPAPHLGGPLHADVCKHAVERELAVVWPLEEAVVEPRPRPGPS